MLNLIHPLRVRVHDRHDLPVGGILRLIERAGSSAALPQVLESLCREVRTILSAPVVSIYVRGTGPEEGKLVMRANVGLPTGAIDRVRLEVGEGITGFAAECLRPVSAEAGPEHDRFKPVPGIGEEAYPSFLAVPLVQGGRALGVMVLQRPAHEPFDQAEIVLGTALAAPFAHALDQTHSSGSRGSSSRDVELAGETVCRGTAVGWARLLPTVSSLLGTMEAEPSADEVAQAFDAVCRDLVRGARRVVEHLAPSAAMAMGALVPLLSDQRLRDRILRECETQGAAAGLDAVARAYARAPYRVGSDAASSEWLAERAQDVEDLCLLVAARLAKASPFRAGDVLWVAGRIGGVVALTAAARRVSAVVSGRVVDREGLGAGILRHAGVAVVGNVSALFEWARPGDKLLVDGTEGSVRVNPAPSRVAQVRLAQSG